MPLDANVTIDGTTWAALALVLTVLGGAWSWLAWRRRGWAAGLRGLAWTLIPLAAWLTGTLRLGVNILNDVLDWAARLVFSPTVWLGVIIAGFAAVLWFVSGILRARGIGVRGGPPDAKGGPLRRLPSRKAKARQAGRADRDDPDDIEAILKKHGI